MTNGSKFTKRTSGERVTVVEVLPARVVIRDQNGNREFVDLSEFAAAFKPATVVVLS